MMCFAENNPPEVWWFYTKALAVNRDTRRQNHIWERVKRVEIVLFFARSRNWVFVNKYFASVQGGSSLTHALTQITVSQITQTAISGTPDADKLLCFPYFVHLQSLCDSCVYWSDCKWLTACQWAKLITQFVMILYMLLPALFGLKTSQCRSSHYRT